ncbi:MAG TPA: glycosyltransferase family 1 protein [Vicinamibacterales bacterium]|nr:glycosyltransferase family 1 protein [Vicinamibacterales bacterium]
MRASSAHGIRVAVCGDFPEERWPSMDRFRAMLLEQLAKDHRDAFEASSVCPPYAHRFTRVAADARLAVKADRFLNRFWEYPRRLERIAHDYDLFHIVDHSYAHLVHALPPGRAVVTCHDLDAFRSLLSPGQERRSGAFRFATRKILTGLQQAASVTCVTSATRRELVARGVVREERTVVAHPGVSDVFRRDPGAAAERAAAALVSAPPGHANGTIDLMHVGSTIPRKRIDVLLRVCGALRLDHPSLRLLRVGGPMTSGQRAIAREAGIADRVVEIDSVDDETLAALYRRAAVVLQPSEREGFGLPLAEAMATGTPIVASDIEALREVGGDAVEYCGVADLDAWRGTVDALLCERRGDSNAWNARRDRGRARAEMFTWRAFTDTVVAVYESLLTGAARQIA